MDIDNEKVLLVPIYRKIISSLFACGYLRAKEIKDKMPEEAESSFFTALKTLEDKGIISSVLKRKKLSIYSLTTVGLELIKIDIDKASSDTIIGIITLMDNIDELICSLIVFDVIKRTGIEIGENVYKELVKKNYEIFINKMRRDLETLTCD